MVDRGVELAELVPPCKVVLQEILIELELASPVARLGHFRLFFFVEDEVAHHQIIHLGAHEAAVSVIRCADHRFAAHIETGVYHYRTAGLGFKDIQ